MEDYDKPPFKPLSDTPEELIGGRKEQITLQFQKDSYFLRVWTESPAVLRFSPADEGYSTMLV